MNQPNYCNQNGWLVPATGWIPASRTEYDFSAPSQTTGCNLLQCHTCEAPVRYGQGFSLPAGTSLAPADLYEAPDWSEIPGIVHDSSTLYACRCRIHTAYANRPLDGPDPDEEDYGIPPLDWHCGGHPTFTLPGTTMGHTLAGESDVVALGRALLDGGWQQHPPAFTLGQQPGFALWRLYSLLQGTGLVDALDQTIAEALTNDSPEVRAVAVAFYAAFPASPSAPLLLTVYQQQPALFEGVSDPFDRDRTLAHRLERALHPQLRQGGHPEMLAVVKEFLLREPAYASDRFRLVLELAPQWTKEQLRGLVKKDVHFLAGWLNHFHKRPVEELLETVRDLLQHKALEPTEIAPVVKDGLYLVSEKADALLQQLGR